MGGGNPSALAMFIPDQQPFVAGIFNCDFFTGMHRELARGVIAQDGRFRRACVQQQFNRDPTFKTACCPAPFPTGKLIIFATDAHMLAGRDGKRVRVLGFVLADDVSRAHGQRVKRGQAPGAEVASLQTKKPTTRNSLFVAA